MSCCGVHLSFLIGKNNHKLYKSPCHEHFRLRIIFVFIGLNQQNMVKISISLKNLKCVKDNVKNHSIIFSSSLK